MAGKGRIENLRPPWQSGHSGNPGGRPRRKPITQAYLELAEAIIPEDVRRKLKLPFGVKVPKGATFAQALSIGMFVAAIRGNAGAAREIREAIEGKTLSPIEFGDRISALARQITVTGIEEPWSPSASKALPAPKEEQSEPDACNLLVFASATRKSAD